MVWQGILFTSVIVRVVGRMGLCVAVMSKLHHSGRMLISSRRKKKKKAKKAWPSGIRAAGKWFSYLDSVLSSAGTLHQDEINNTLLTENLASKKSPHCVLSLLLQNNSNPEVKVPTVFSKNICMILYWGRGEWMYIPRGSSVSSKCVEELGLEYKPRSPPHHTHMLSSLHARSGI